MAVAQSPGTVLAQNSSWSGTPSSKVSAATLATATATLFWTIVANTFWTTVQAADLATYISATAIILTALIGFVVPDSEAYGNHVIARAAATRARKVRNEELMAHLKAVETKVDKPNNEELMAHVKALEEKLAHMEGAARNGLTHEHRAA